MMTTFLFPGQGSQQRGMGEALIKQYPQFIKKADQILGYSIEELCLHDRLEQLKKTEYTQPAIFVINALHYIDYIKNHAEFPDFLIGHSLGEYNALFAANVFDFESALCIVKKRAALMGQAGEGGMLAVIGLSVDQIKEVLLQHDLQLLAIANINSYQQIVISGDLSQLQQATTFLTNAGAQACIPLKVSGAFHTKYMTQASKAFLMYLNDFNFFRPTKTVISNVTGKPYASEDIKEMLARQIVSPVQWLNSIVYVLAQGETRFIELGQGKVMTNLVEKIKNNQ